MVRINYGLYSIFKVIFTLFFLDFFSLITCAVKYLKVEQELSSTFHWITVDQPLVGSKFFIPSCDLERQWQLFGSLKFYRNPDGHFQIFSTISQKPPPKDCQTKNGVELHERE
jgi:hypothetical protein